jgi:hypothetical protein
VPNLSIVTNCPRFEATAALIDEDGVECYIVCWLCFSPTTASKLRDVTIITDRKTTKISSRISIHVDTVENTCMRASERASPRTTSKRISVKVADDAM